MQRLSLDPLLREHLLIDPLRYASYAHNRALGMSAEGAARVFGAGADTLEQRYRRAAVH